MDGDGAADRIKGEIAKKVNGYFSSHRLTDMLEGAGMDGSPGAVVAFALRLVEDDAMTFLEAASAGLREAATDDDESARAIDATVRRVRYDAFQKQFVDALIDVGRSRPGPAVGLAARLIKLGDADYAAYLIGGAYGGACSECEGMIEHFLSRGEDEEWVAAAVRSLRIAGAGQGAPSTERTMKAVRRAMDLGGTPALQEAMELALDACERGHPDAKGAIESMASGWPACRAVLASRIGHSSPFDDAEGLRLLSVCLGVCPDKRTVYSTYRALADIAGREPRGAARRLAWLFSNGWYHDAFAGRVLEEIGRKGAAETVMLFIDMLQTRDRRTFSELLYPIIKRTMRFADYGEVAGRVMRATGEGTAAPGDCLTVLGIIEAESGEAGRREEFAAGVVDGIRGHAAGAAPGGAARPGAAALRAPAAPGRPARA